MKYLSAVFGVLLVGAMACAAGGPKVTLPAVQPEDVEMFYPGDYPSEKYEVLKRIEIQDILSAQDQDMVMAARQQAADIGADALLIQSMRTTQSGSGLGDADPSRDRKILEALAVYYPSR
ncbi:MAG TPA: hypothetical protein VLC48_10440, partial [Gemmatimonadota bacterium]|nr:hypothetical protein [Gemmatimonadota bacterium]